MRWTWVGLLAMALAAPLSAQQNDPIQALATNAQAALDRLDYVAARDIARTLLEVGEASDRETEVLALQLLSAALYPEEESQQNESEARSVLERLIRTGPDAHVPASMSWPGLDDLLTQTRMGVLALFVDAPASTQLQGIEAELALRVRTTRPARLSMSVVRGGGTDPIILASAGNATDVVLRTKPASPEGGGLLPGSYTMIVEARDQSTTQTESRRFTMEIEGPAFEGIADPVFDEARLLPTRSEGRSWPGLAVGVGLGALTAIAATTLGAQDPASQAGSDNRAFVVAGSLSLATLAAVVMDGGRDLPDNRAHNDALRAAHERSVRSARLENARRARELQYVITLEPIGGP